MRSVSSLVGSIAFNSLNYALERVYNTTCRRVPMLLIGERTVGMCLASHIILVIDVVLPGRWLEDIRVAHIWRGNAARYTVESAPLRSVGVDDAHDSPLWVIEECDFLSQYGVSRYIMLSIRGAKVPVGGKERLVHLGDSAPAFALLPTPHRNLRYRCLFETLDGDHAHRKRL